jgi:hypothetical protein
MNCETTPEGQRLVARAQDMLDMLKRLEWLSLADADDRGALFCPVCLREQPTHSQACELEALLDAIEGE